MMEHEFPLALFVWSENLNWQQLLVTQRELLQGDLSAFGLLQADWDSTKGFQLLKVPCSVAEAFPVGCNQSK